MRILPPVEEEIRRIVRDERAKDPLVTVSGFKAALEEHFERGFSHQYVSKIADKIAREGLIEADRTQIEARMIFTRENYRMVRERMLKIIYWTPDDLFGRCAPTPEQGTVTLSEIACDGHFTSRYHAAATTSCHACIADALKARCVLAEVEMALDVESIIGCCMH
jgi:hypothetical protein